MSLTNLESPSWQPSNTYANTNPDPNAYTYPNSSPYTDSYSNPNAYTNSSSSWRDRIGEDRPKRD
jgi:hypothetical protein